jgi:hypothetical protein
MRPITRVLGTVSLGIGVDPRKILLALRALPRYLRDVYVFLKARRAARDQDFRFQFVPFLADLHAQSGNAKGHYFHQDIWAARIVFQRRPNRHVDVGSRVDGFVAHLLSFREVEVIDIRPLSSRVSGLKFIGADVMRFAHETRGELRSDSVSCLHALEHFGLGRYGDPIDADGWRRGLAGLAQLVLPGGVLLLSVPVGRPRIEFNTQRIFSPSMIVVEAERHGLRLIEFSLVDDAGDFESNAAPDLASQLDFGCGCFLFQRPEPT